MDALKGLYKGQTAIMSRIFTAEDVNRCCELTKDFSPVYNLSSDAWKGYYKKPIVPALLTEGLITQVISSELPGIPCVLLQKDLVFYSPVYIGDLITVELTIIDINYERNWLTQKVTCFDEEGNELIKGQVVIFLLSNKNDG